MEIANSTLKLKFSNDHNLIDFMKSNFKNEEYILKLNTIQFLKFFKDELTIKFLGKGHNSCDYAVRILLII